MAHQAERVLDAAAAHGEGPSWDGANGVLYWVDITGFALHVFDPGRGTDRALDLGQFVCAVAPRSKGGVVAALGTGFGIVDTVSGEVTMLCDPEEALPGNRFNDGKCSPDGRFWAGTCAKTCDIPGAGSLYCLEADGQTRNVLPGVTISNGLAWSADAQTMYYIDTPTMEVAAFDYCAQTGSISDRRTVVSVPEACGFPDGMTIDAEGMLWVAHWGGGCVRRWNPGNGKMLDEVRLPVQLVSSCAFGGANLDVLYITSSRLGLDEDALREQPAAGGLFAVKPGVTGFAADAYAG